MIEDTRNSPVEYDLYYLNSRYYNPELRRFISPDSIKYLEPESINGLNLYAYCGNDPVNNVDPNGHFAISLLVILAGALIGALVGVGTTVYNDAKDGVLFNENNWDYLYYGLGGAITGAIGGVFAQTTFVAQLLVAGGLGAISNVSDGLYTGDLNSESNFIDFFSVGFKGAVISGSSFLMTYGLTSFAIKSTYKNIVGKKYK